MVYQYEWGGYHFPVSADIVGQQCEQIEKEEGTVTKQNLVDYSRDDKSELHCLFEWDDQIAGEAYRREQAGRILSSLKMVVLKSDAKQVKVKAYVNVSEEKTAKYMNIELARQDADKMNVVLQNAIREMQTFILKYRGLSELEPVFDAMETAMEGVKNGQKRTA